MPELIGIFLSAVVVIVGLLLAVGFIGLYAAFWMWLSEGAMWGLACYIGSLILPAVFITFYQGGINFFG